VTGAVVRQMTDQPAVHHHFYFTNPSFTPNGRFLLFVAYRTGWPNLFAAHGESGELYQLTEIEDLNPFSATPARDSARVFYTAGEEVRAVYLEGGDTEVVGSFPDASLGNCHLSADGSWVVTNVRRNGRNAITAVMTGGATGSTAHTVLETEKEVGHIQFAPTVDNAIQYSSDARHRIWTVNFDGSEDRWLYRQGPEEWITHESWRGSGEEILFTQWPRALMAVSRDGERVRTIAPFNAWHAASRRDGGLIVCDTTLPDSGLQLVDPETGERRVLCYPGATSKGSQWKQPLPAENPVERPHPSRDREGAEPFTPVRDREGAVETAAACDTGRSLTVAARTPSYCETTYGPQWTHPHPSFSPDGRSVVYTSDVSGHSQVYVVSLGE
jgi:oligogalacturonide lyase